MRQRTDFDVERVARDILQLNIRKRCGSEIVALCPKCGDRSGHLYMNTVKGVVYCHKCGYKGGILGLYMDLQGIADAREAAGQMREGLGGACHSATDTPKALKDCGLAVLSRRDAVYRKFLSMLVLKPEHEENLKDRGFERFGLFRSTPSKSELSEIMKSFTVSEIRGVPGFYEKDGKPRATLPRHGIFVPYLAECGKVQGLQVRTDSSIIRRLEDKGIRTSKYAWFSSSWVNGALKNGHNGCGGSFTHFAVDFDKGRPVFDRRNADGDTVCGITEGAMKAQLFHEATGTPCIAIAGVGIQADLPRVFRFLRSSGVTAVYSYFDMDCTTNPNVRRASDELERKILAAGFVYHRECWNKEYKGVDDYVVQLKGNGRLTEDNRFCFHASKGR